MFKVILPIAYLIFAIPLMFAAPIALVIITLPAMVISEVLPRSFPEDVGIQPAFLIWALGVIQYSLIGWAVDRHLHRHRQRVMRGRCVGCGYSLVGLVATRCPECGKELTQAERTPPMVGNSTPPAPPSSDAGGGSPT